MKAQGGRKFFISNIQKHEPELIIDYEDLNESFF